MGSSEKIHVVIVDDLAETREKIKKVLDMDDDLEVVGSAGNGRESIEIAKSNKPDVVIMDISMPDMDGIAATEAIRRISPHTQVVILSVQADSEYMRKAMLVGARDFLTKPPAIDELLAAVKQAGQLAIEEKEKALAQSQLGSPTGGVSLPGGSLGRVITFFSPKGGVGCTTVATNIGVTLHNIETPVVMVDGKFQFGDVAVFFNEHGKNSIADLAPRVDELDRDIIEDVLITHKASGVKLLAAPSHPELAEDINSEQFVKIIHFLKRIFSYVIVESSDSLTDTVLVSLDSSDLIVLLTTQEIPAIKNVRLFFDVADILKIDRKKILFILNQFDKRIGITSEKIGESLKHEIVAVLPADERLVIPSINRGMPFMLGDKTRPLAKAYLSLAEVIKQRLHELSVEESESLPVRSGVFHRNGK
jgi:pilus assembly protein CpaE